MTLITELLLVIFCTVVSAFCASWLGNHVGNRGLERKHYSLECDIEDLRQTVMREVKRRAGEAGMKARSVEADILAAAESEVTPKRKKQPWFVKFQKPKPQPEPEE